MRYDLLNLCFRVNMRYTGSSGDPGPGSGLPCCLPPAGAERLPDQPASRTAVLFLERSLIIFIISEVI